MVVIGHSAATAWIFPAIIDTAVAVSTLMLVALGDKPTRRSRTGALPANTQTPAMREPGQSATQSAKDQVRRFAPGDAGGKMVDAKQVQTFASVQRGPARTVEDSAQTEATQDAEIAQLDADLASEMIASGVTTQPVETVIAVLAATRDGASINAAAKASGINYRTAQRIVGAAAERRQLQLVAVG
jgi:hypothetical protein